MIALIIFPNIQTKYNPLKDYVKNNMNVFFGLFGMVTNKEALPFMQINKKQIYVRKQTLLFPRTNITFLSLPIWW
jgi:hypothetical protein